MVTRPSIVEGVRATSPTASSFRPSPQPTGKETDSCSIARLGSSSSTSVALSVARIRVRVRESTGWRGLDQAVLGPDPDRPTARWPILRSAPARLDLSPRSCRLPRSMDSLSRSFESATRMMSAVSAWIPASIGTSCRPVATRPQSLKFRASSSPNPWLQAKHCAGERLSLPVPRR